MTNTYKDLLLTPTQEMTNTHQDILLSHTGNDEQTPRCTSYYTRSHAHTHTEERTTHQDVLLVYFCQQVWDIFQFLQQLFCGGHQTFVCLLSPVRKCQWRSGHCCEKFAPHHENPMLSPISGPNRGVTTSSAETNQPNVSVTLAARWFRCGVSILFAWFMRG